MGLFSRKKKKQDNPNNQPAGNASPKGGRAPKRAKQKFHSRRKKSNLVSDMKISGSVPTTIIDAIHGDKSIISSDRDFVQAEKVNVNGKVYYPVFVIDEDTLEKSGIADSANRKVYGQLSTGLKTSSGATGLLPIVTPQSEQNDYFAILPMHDAFDFLNSQAVFADYSDGWVVGLLNIDNDELTLQKTNLRLTMAEWIEYINGKLHFQFEGGQLHYNNEVPKNSDPLAFQGAEKGLDDNSNGAAPQSASPFDEFDTPEGADNNQASVESSASNQPPVPNNNPVKADTNAKPDFEHRNGYGIDDLPVDDGDATPNSSDGNVAPNPAPATNDNGDTVTPQPGPAVNQNQSANASVTPQPVANPNVNQNGNVANGTPNVAPATPQSQAPAQPQDKTLNSPDELEADNLTLSASVRTLNDLKISISDREFVDAYMKPLTISPIPLADDSTDPTGRIHHLNELRQQANLELASAEKTVRSRMRQWFETQRAGELDALNQGVRDNGSQINKKRDHIKKLRENLDNTDALTNLAKHDLQPDLDKMDEQFNQERENDRRLALLQVESQYTERQSQLEQHKKERIAQQVAKQRDDISKEINSEKVKIQQIAQTAALQGYTQIMKLGAVEFRNSQQLLERLHDKLVGRLEQYEKQSRDEENRRVNDQADIARNDTTVTTLREQLAQADNAHKIALDRQEQSFKQKLSDADRNLTTYKQKLEADKQAEIAKADNQVKVAQNQVDEASKRLTTQQNTYEQMIKARDDDNAKKVQAVRDEMKQALDTNNQSFKRFKLLILGSVVCAVFFGGVLGFAIGVVNSFGGSKQTTQSVSPTVAYTPQLAPVTPSSSSTTSSSSSSSSDNSSSQSHDNHSRSHNDKDKQHDKDGK